VFAFAFHWASLSVGTPYRVVLLAAACRAFLKSRNHFDNAVAPRIRTRNDLPFVPVAFSSALAILALVCIGFILSVYVVNTSDLLETG